MSTPTKYARLEQEVRRRYEQQLPSRGPWADWLFTEHVLVTADKAEMVARRFGFDTGLARVAGLLHGIADYEIAKRSKAHEERSFEIARELLEEFGFSEQEKQILLEDALPRHSCHGDTRPQSDIGKVLATADALAHLQADFYFFAALQLQRDGMSFADVQAWLSEKIERDFRVKILFEEVARDAEADYKRLYKIINNS